MLSLARLTSLELLSLRACAKKEGGLQWSSSEQPSTPAKLCGCVKTAPAASHETWPAVLANGVRHCGTSDGSVSLVLSEIVM